MRSELTDLVSQMSVTERDCLANAPHHQLLEQLDRGLPEREHVIALIDSSGAFGRRGVLALTTDRAISVEETGVKGMPWKDMTAVYPTLSERKRFSKAQKSFARVRIDMLHQEPVVWLVGQDPDAGDAFARSARRVFDEHQLSM